MSNDKPWSVCLHAGEIHIDRADGESIAQVWGMDIDGEPRPEAMTIASLIVAAVNHHDEMLTLLRHLKDNPSAMHHLYDRISLVVRRIDGEAKP